MTKYTFILNCGSKKGIVRTVEADAAMNAIALLAGKNLENEAEGTATIFIVDVLRITGEEKVSVRNKVLTAYYDTLRSLKNELRSTIERVKHNPLYDLNGKLQGYYETSEVDGKLSLHTYYPNGLLKSVQDCVVQEV